MTDYFALLQQPRRPWLDLDKLKEEQHRQTMVAHPDVKPVDADAPHFASLNEAYRVLADPRLRLQHLLVLEGAPATTEKIPGELTDAFLETGTVIQEIDRLLGKLSASALGKALLRPEILEKQQRAAELLEKLRHMSGQAMDQLKMCDREWAAQRKDLPALAALSSRLAYLGRWIAQVEERIFQLSVV